MKKRIILFSLCCVLFIGFHTGVNAQVLWNSTTNTGTYSSALGYQSQSTNSYSFSAGWLSKANGFCSMSLGCNSTAAGNYSTTIGQSNHAAHQSYAIGQSAKAFGEQSLAIGRFVETSITGLNSIIIGSSISTKEMVNNIPSSLMVGFNSTVPTLFIGPSASYTGIGKVGIGTTAPQANLHIKSMNSTDATLFVQPGTWNSTTKAAISLGDDRHGLVADMNNGLSFFTQKNFIFNDGFVGIGTQSPQALLHVERGNTILNGNVQLGSISNEIVTLINGKVGIKTNNPLADLQVEGSVSIGYSTHTPPGMAGLIVNGPVGIGTFSPSCQLEVAGKIKTTELQLTTGYMKDYILQSDENGNAQWVNPVNVNTGIWIQNGNNVTVDNTKKVGIGTTTPAEALDLKGNMLCSGNIKGGRTDWQSFGIYANSSETDGSYILLGNNSTQAGSIKLYSTGTSGRIEFHNQNMQVMSIRADNNVYFGNPDEATNIFVNGEITSSLV